MGSKSCMNVMCRSRGTVLSEWKKGWSLRLGGFARLCYNCGLAYENSIFCETFHLEETGWRKCRVCGKRLHCGCNASKHLQEYIDYGGVGCINCLKRMSPVQVPCDTPNDTFIANGCQDLCPAALENRTDDDKFKMERLLQLTKPIGVSDISSALEKFEQEDSVLKNGQSSKHVLNLAQQCSTPGFLKMDNSRIKEGVKDMYEPAAQPSLSFPLTSHFGSPSVGLTFLGGITEGSEQSKGSRQQGQRARHILPKPSKPSVTVGSETNKGTVSQARVARPPAEGRGRNQLLPRYWPKITDQELQQLSGDLKSSIVPLFEKILSASDAGRIGRLVLPKACAEAYFPPINQSEGIPIKIQDIKGKEWTFQFRYWPNNNSRMYVLEGVTPCIQNMQVQAGDTVTFSRIEPGGKLVIGCRITTNNPDALDSQTAAVPNGDSAAETLFYGASDNMLLNGSRKSDELLQRHLPVLEKKKARNIKNKRLLMHNDDVMELRITWEEAQELLRPSPSAEPTVVMVEDHEFEEFEEPPIFGKRTVFTSRPSGEQDQVVQCDNCRKWRRVPVRALLAAKWTCSDNMWDLKRQSCSAPEDINPRDLEKFFYKGKRRISSVNQETKEEEPSGLDALATAAALGDNGGDIAESSVGATTRHPRHRPGCTCIVCIQPPSGKGKHEPTCKCNVCLTVRRRFKTLMMRKKRRQSEREAELAQGKEKVFRKSGLEREEDISGRGPVNMNNPDGEIGLEDINKGQLDLNCDPHREDDILAEAAGMNSTTLNETTLSADMLMEKNDVPMTGYEENGGNKGFTSGDVEQAEES